MASSSKPAALGWRIYYGDGSTYDENDGPPAEAPKRNVQAIVVTDDAVGFAVMESFDFYWYDPVDREPDEWYGGDRFGLFDYLIRPGSKIVLFGRSIPTAEYEAIVKAAREDPDFPRKSATNPSERPESS